jgi:hypothetical protein
VWRRVNGEAERWRSSSSPALRGTMLGCRKGKLGGSVWQNQSELHRLKCASPLSRASTYFKQCNPLACRVTSRYSTECRIKQGTSHEGESSDTIAITFYIIGRYITWVFKSNISSQLRENYYKTVQGFKPWQRSLKHGHCTRRWYGYHASPNMISLGRISLGRGWVPLHGPTIGQRVRPWHRQSRVLRGIT